jgi:predicted phage terminase large subunit-like protein
MVKVLAQKWKANQVLIEEAGTAIALIEDLKHEVRGLEGVKPDLTKETRMSTVTGKFESGKVYFPDQAPWLSDLETELFAFPGSSYDDQVDSISQALRYCNTTLASFIRIGRRAASFPISHDSYWPQGCFRPGW